MRRRQHLAKQTGKAIVAGGGEPLDFVFVGVRLEAEQFGDAAVQIADGIRIVHLGFEFQTVALAAIARAAAEIAGAVEGQHSGVVETRGVVRGGGMRGLMLHQRELALGNSERNWAWISAPVATGCAIAT